MIVFDPNLDHDECVETSEIFSEDLEETQLIDLTKDGNYSTDTLFGISYTRFLKQIEAKKIDKTPFIKKNIINLK